MAVKLSLILCLVALGVVIIVMQLEKTDFDPGGSIASYLLLNRQFIQIRQSFPRARRKRQDCHLYNCFDIFKCSSHTGHIKVHIYPLEQYLDESGTTFPLSEEFQSILDTVYHSKFYTADPEEACLFLPSIDTLSATSSSSKSIEQALANLPHWNSGVNHIIFTVQSGDFSLSTDQAIVVGSGQTTLEHRSGFDVSLPFILPLNFHQTFPSISDYENRSMSLGNSQSSATRPWRLLATREQLSMLGNVVHDDSVLVVDDLHSWSCAGQRAQSGLWHRCVDGKLHSWHHLLESARFCLVSSAPRASSLELMVTIQRGCVPVILSDLVQLPFGEVLDWSLFSLRLRRHNRADLMQVIRNADLKRYTDLNQMLSQVWSSYFSSPAKIAESMLHILNDRIYSQNVRTKQRWNLPDVSNPPIFLHRYPRTNTGFTAVILTYDRLQSLYQILQKLSDVPSLTRIVVVWNHQVNSPPPVDAWPKVNKKIKVVQTAKNLLSNRFYPYTEIETECVMSMDDDITMLTPMEIEFGYQVWREFPDRLVGFPSRTHRWDSNSNSWKYESEWKNEHSLVLTGAAFYHKYWHYLYTAAPNSRQKLVREWANDHMNCEDIAFNFMVANVTGKPVIKVGPRKKFRCVTASCENASMLSASDTHLIERSQCLDLFAKTYGYLPVKQVEFRADPALYLDPVPSSLNSFHDINGSL